MGPAFSLATTMGPMVAAAGGLAPLALVLLTGVMGLVAIAFARMLRILPNAGSSYSWIRSAFGNGVGAYGAWLLILSNVFAVLATALPAGAYTLDLLAPRLAASPLWIAVVACGWTAASAALLWAGLRPTSRVAALLFFGEVAVLAVMAARAFAHPPAVAQSSAPAHIGIGGLILAMALGIWMTDGWEVTASTSEEAQGGRDVPGSSGLIGLGVTSAMLLVCMIAFMRVGTVAGFSDHAEDSLAYVGVQLGSAGWSIVIGATVLISLMAALQTTFVYLSRSVYAMGRDGVLPEWIGKLDRRGVPTAAIIVVAGIVLALTLTTGFSQSARDAYNVVLAGSAIFLGALFMFSTAAAARTFARDAHERVTGIAVPLAATAALGAILVVGVLQSDGPTRASIVGGLLLGLPLAFWRSSAAERAPEARDGDRSGRHTETY